MKIISKHQYDNEVYELVYQYWIVNGFNPNKEEEILNKLQTQYNINKEEAIKLMKEYFNKGRVL